LSRENWQSSKLVQKECRKRGFFGLIHGCCKNACFPLRYNRQDHRSEPHSRIEDWMANFPLAGIREMCTLEQFFRFTREPQRRRVGLMRACRILKLPFSLGQVRLNLIGSAVDRDQGERMPQALLLPAPNLWEKRCTAAGHRARRSRHRRHRTATSRFGDRCNSR
jgi:hypothetical protein